MGDKKKKSMSFSLKITGEHPNVFKYVRKWKIQASEIKIIKQRGNLPREIVPSQNEFKYG